MNNIHGLRLKSVLTLAIVTVLGIGAVSGTEHPTDVATVGTLSVAALPAPWVSVPDGGNAHPQVHAAGGRTVVPEGFPKDFHREERLLDDEYEHNEAAPHTLGRFGSGSA